MTRRRAPKKRAPPPGQLLLPILLEVEAITRRLEELIRSMVQGPRAHVLVTVETFERIQQASPTAIRLLAACMPVSEAAELLREYAARKEETR